MNASLWFRLAAFFGFVAVALGAFGAHSLRGSLKEELDHTALNKPEPGRVSAARRLEVFDTGVRYQMFHALALFVVAWLIARAGVNIGLASAAGWAFLIGILLFSGSLYALGFTGKAWLGAITPLGGVAFLIGWATLIVLAGDLDVARAAALTP